MKFDEFFNQYFGYKNRTFSRSIARQILVINPFFSVVFSLTYNGFENLGRVLIVSYAIASIVSTVVTTILYTSKYFDTFIRNLQQKPERTPPKVWWFVLSICSMPIGLYIAAIIMPTLGPVLGAGPIHISPESFRTSVVIGGLLGGVFFVGGIFLETKKSLKQSELKLKELENQHLQSQISALTAQMNPHLLFNSLNTVASLVATDPSKAEETIVTLSELYRGVLNSSKNMTHSLKTELDLCEAYLKIEKARFGDRVRSEFDVSDQIDISSVQIPSLCLQPLVENAVKHGILKRASGGLIRITAIHAEDILKICVEDDGIGVESFPLHNEKASTKGTGTGLANSRERIHLHYGNRGSFVIGPRLNGGTIVTIGIPAPFSKETL